MLYLSAPAPPPPPFPSHMEAIVNFERPIRNYFVRERHPLAFPPSHLWDLRSRNVDWRNPKHTEILCRCTLAGGENLYRCTPAGGAPMVGIALSNMPGYAEHEALTYSGIQFAASLPDQTKLGGCAEKKRISTFSLTTLYCIK
jgi:hypothetical protein